MRMRRSASRALASSFAALLLLQLANCAGGGGRRASLAGLNETPRYYPPPGPPQDPWGPYLTEAATRFGLPETWLRAVLHQESGGQQQAVSPVGAMGLMQLMPQTYAEMRDQYGLGNDPFQPRDNIFAGAAYLRLMYDRFGAPGFLAAYNAGPQRLQQYLTTGTPLPDETVNYVAAIAPELGPATQFTGPLAAYADTRLAERAPAPDAASFAAGCDANLAYDPAHPCHALEHAASAPAVASAVASAVLVPPPPAPVPEPVVVASAAPVIAAPGIAAPVIAPPVIAPSSPSREIDPGGWGIQVGAFASPGLAQSQALRAQHEAADLLSGATLSMPVTTPFGGRVLYRARLVGLPQTLAELACQRLNAAQLPCLIVRPRNRAA